MGLQEKSRRDREHDKFAEGSGGETLVQTKILDSTVPITNTDGMLGGITYDYVSMTLSTTSSANDTETYTFKSGGSGGSTVATVVIVYQSSSREDISTVTKS